MKKKEEIEIDMETINPAEYMSYSLTGQHTEVYCPNCGYRQKSDNGLIPLGLSCPLCETAMMGNLT